MGVGTMTVVLLAVAVVSRGETFKDGETVCFLATVLRRGAARRP
jgi:hypothetical protein